MLPLLSRLTSASVRMIAGRTFTCSSASLCTQQQKPVVTVSVDETTGVATMLMCRKPVNSLNLEMLTEMNITLEKLENDKNVRALVLGSSLPKIYSAGIDISELYAPDRGRCEQFWRTLQTLWIRLYGSRLPTVAAISGNSPAGGCLLAMSCDYRIMLDGNYSIGLNETLLGIVAPLWFRDVMVNTIGNRQTERALQMGTLFKPRQALAIYLVDELVTSESDLTKACEREAAQMAMIPEAARILTKEMMRRDTIIRLQARIESDVEAFIGLVMRDSTQTNLKAYVDALKRRSAKSKL